MYKRVLIIIFLLAVAAAVIGVRQYLALSRTPGFAVSQIQAAIAGHDIEKFEEYVDLDTLLERTMDDVLATSVGSSEDGGQDRLAEEITEGFLRLIGPYYIVQTRKNIRDWVLTGQPPETPAGAEDSTPGRPPALGMTSLRELHYQGMVDQRVEGKSAWVSLKFRHERYQEDIEVVLFMRRSDTGRFRVTAIENAAELAARLQTLEQKWRENKNQPVRQSIENAIKLVSVKKRTTSARWVRESSVHFWFSLQNRGNSIINRLEAVLEIRPEKNLGPAKSFDLRFTDMGLEPGETDTYYWEFAVPLLGQVEEKIYQTPLEEMDLSFKVTSLVLENGETLTLPYPEK